MKLYEVSGKFEIDDIKENISMNIFAKEKEEAISFLKENIMIAPALEDDWWEEDDVKLNTSIVGVKLFDENIFKNKSLWFTIPMIGGEYFFEGRGLWEEIKEEIFNCIGKEVGRIGTIYINGIDCKDITFYMKNNFYSKSAINAIEHCNRLGISPFGH